MSGLPPALPPRSKATPAQAVTEATSTALPPPNLPPRQRGSSATQVTQPVIPSSSEPIADFPIPVITPERRLPPLQPSRTTEAHAVFNRLHEYWLGAIRRTDTPEEAALRRDLEEDEVIRYLTSFQKHAKYFRVDQPAPVVAREKVSKPDLNGYRHTTQSSSRKSVIAVETIDETGLEHDAVPPSTTILESSLDIDANASVRVDATGAPAEAHPISSMPGSLGSPRSAGKATGDPTDWFGYIVALLQYYTQDYVPTMPQSAVPESFTIARMRSSSERLYVAARPPWESFGLMLGEVILWKDWKRSATWAATYALLVITSKFIPLLLSIPLYHLVKARFFPPSPYYLLAQAQHTKRRAEEAHAISEDVLQTPLGESTNPEGEPITSASTASGIKINLGEAAARLGMGEAASRIEAELEATVKPAKENRRLWKAWKAFEVAHGTGLVIVTDDVADMHEKLANLFAWKRPEASTHAIIFLSMITLASFFVSNIVALKAAQVGLGVLLFAVIPIVARKERYDPLAWLFGASPTDAEYVTDLLRKRQASGEGIPDIYKIKRERAKQARTQSIASESITLSGGDSDLGDDIVVVADTGKKRLSGGVDWAGIGETSVKWLDGGRSILKGEVGVKLGWKEGDTPGLASGSSGPMRELKLGTGGYGITIASKTASQSDLLANSTAFLAVHKGKSGSLAISPGGIHFSTFLAVPKPKPPKPSKAATKALKALPPDAQSTLEQIAKDQAEAEEKAALAAASAIDPSGIVEIRMDDLVGIKKSSKSSLMVVITSGIEVELQGGKILSFPFVANRDQAFNLLLALSPQSFRKV